MKEIFSILFKFRLSPWILALSIGLSFLSASLEGVSIGLLIPLLNGLISSDFKFLENIKILHKLLNLLPESISRHNSSLFIFLTLLIFASIIIKNILNYFASISVLYQVRRFANNLRKTIYDRYLSFGKLFFDRNNLGNLHQILATNTDQIARELYSLQNHLYNLFTLFVYIIMMICISFKLTAIVLLAFPFLYYSLRWLINKIENTSLSYSNSYSRMGSKISDSLSCIPLVKAYTNEQKEKEWFSHISDSLERIEFNIDKKRTLIPPVQEIIMLCMILLLIVSIAFFYIKEQSATFASYMVFLLILRRSVGTFGSFNNMKASFAYLKGPFTEIKNILSDNEKYFIAEGNKEFKGLKQTIQFDHVSFSYLEGVSTVKDISFTVEKGNIVALVGQSGSGKTTLINLLMRFYEPYSGEISIDGVNINEFTLKSLRSKMALVSQETYLFNTSLRANLTYGLEYVPDDLALIEVLKKAKLYDYVQKLPEGLETTVGDRGVKLSGGEKQRVSIARAMLKNAEILILDEATSSLDSETEKLIQEALNELIKDKTVIVIAHRLSTVKNADKIIVLENGEIQEEGSLSKLVSNKHKFYKYWTAQRF